MNPKILNDIFIVVDNIVAYISDNYKWINQDELKTLKPMLMEHGFLKLKCKDNWVYYINLNHLVNYKQDDDGTELTFINGLNYFIDIPIEDFKLVFNRHKFHNKMDDYLK